MDAIKYLIGFFFKLAFGALFVAVVWWLVSLLFPALSFSRMQSLVINEEKKDFLPSPRAYLSLIKARKVPTENANVYVHGEAFDGYNLEQGAQSGAAQLVAYSSPSATSSWQNEVTLSTQAPPRSMYIRNLSIYEGGHVYTGLSFVGEARNEMFKDGAFQVVAMDQRGGIIGMSPAVSTGAWSVPGWSRFSTRINYVLPPGGIPCSIVFQQAKDMYSASASSQVKVGIPVTCN